MFRNWVCTSQKHLASHLQTTANIVREVICVFYCENQTKPINTVYSTNAEFLGAFAKLRKATISFVMSVCLSVCLPSCLSVRPSVRPSACNNSAPTERIFMQFDIWGFFRKFVEKIQVSLKSDKNNGYFTWTPLYIYDNISLNSS
jgi:hypothetical protein